MFRRRNPIHCPKCNSTSVKIEKIRDGTGVVAMGPASVGSVSSPMSSVLGGQPMAPLPSIQFSRENVLGNKRYAICKECKNRFLINGSD